MVERSNDTSNSHSIREVLAAGWRLFTAGLSTAFPWVLAAELIPELPFANPPGNIFDTDLSLFVQPAYLSRAVLFGATQALFYGIAVIRLAGLTGSAPQGRIAIWDALRAVPAVLVAYVCYELVVAIGLLFTFAFFMLGLFVIGLLGGLVLCIIPLAPTAAVSTALALFIFPAVLEKRNPFAALGESSRLAKGAWVKVSLVISVPALLLLVAAVVTDYQSLSHSVSTSLDLLRRTQEEGVSMQDADTLLAGFKAAPDAGRYGSWQLIGTVLGAFCWWYTLAVCYAQYRDLKQGSRP
jgi:hypothetical protein